MLEEARPQVQTEEAQLVVERCLHELRQAIDLSAQVQQLEQRIEVQVSQNPELQSDDDQSPAGAGASPYAAGRAQPADYWASNVPVAQMHQTRTRRAARREQEEQLRRQIRGSAKKLMKLEDR